MVMFYTLYIATKKNSQPYNHKAMKVKLYNMNVVTDIIDCNDIDHVDNPCYFDDVVRVHLRNHQTKLCDDLVFLTEEESNEVKSTLNF